MNIMNIINWFRRVPKEPPDPATLPSDQWSEAVDARSDLGLQPWPNQPPYHYFNTVVGRCSRCGRNIYGGQAISIGSAGTYCGKHWD